MYYIAPNVISLLTYLQYICPPNVSHRILLEISIRCFPSSTNYFLTYLLLQTNELPTKLIFPQTSTFLTIHEHWLIRFELLYRIFIVVI